MISYGIHFGCFTIRISRCFRRSLEDDIQFRSLTQLDYGMEDWWPLYQGGMPNVYDPETCTVGYEALKEVRRLDFTRLRRFDQKFFEGFVDHTNDKSPEYSIWKKLLTSLYQGFFQKPNSGRIGLYLEAVNLVKKGNSWMPWVSGEDLHDQLESTLQTHFSSLGFGQLSLLREKQVVENEVLPYTDLKAGELLLSLGSERSSFRLIIDPKQGKTQLLENCPGINSLVNRIQLDGEYSLVELLNFLHQNDNQLPEKLSLRLREWRKNDLIPALYHSWDLINDVRVKQKVMSQNLWVAGEGTYLMAGLNDKVKVVERPLYWQADAVAKYISLSDQT